MSGREGKYQLKTGHSKSLGNWTCLKECLLEKKVLKTVEGSYYAFYGTCLCYYLWYILIDVFHGFNGWFKFKYPKIKI